MAYFSFPILIVSGRLVNATASEVEHIVRDCLFDQIPESSINELVDFFIFERRLYLKNSGL